MRALHTAIVQSRKAVLTSASSFALTKTLGLGETVGVEKIQASMIARRISDGSDGPLWAGSSVVIVVRELEWLELIDGTPNAG